MFVITILLRQRELFAKQPRLQLSLGGMRGLFWSGAGRRKGGKELGTIPALPDEVFDPLMTEALRWLDVYSADIIELRKIEAEAAERCASWRSKNKTYYINRHLVGFQFSKNPLTNLPWRDELRMIEEVLDVDETGTLRQKLGPLGVLRRLISNLLAACSVVIQGFTGLRISELLGLRAEAYFRSDLFPSCISIRPSLDGLNQVFLLNGEIFKGAVSESSREGQWVVGIRPVDSDFVPEAVRALILVLEVVEGWRNLTQDTHVFIHPKAQGMPRSKDGVGAARSNLMRKLQQQFLVQWVELPVEFAGWHLSTHQFRKKFAQDIVRCDPGALPAVREHFKHMSMHILETGYIGSDAELLRLIDDFALRDAAAQIMSIIDGEPVAGKMSDEIRRATPRIRQAYDNSISEEDRRKKIEGLIDSEGIRAWPCDFGTCLFRAETAMCHFAGRGFYDPSALKPLASERCADRCSSCSNLVVSARNLQFWKDRYRHNERLRLAYKEEGNTSWALLASRRVQVAASMLQAHGISPKDLAHAA
jgi:integrase